MKYFAIRTLAFVLGFCLSIPEADAQTPKGKTNKPLAAAVKSAKGKTAVQRKASVQPVIAHCQSVDIDKKNNVHHIKKGILEVAGGTLVAEEVDWDKSKERLIAKTASFKSKDGKKITSALINFNLKDGSYTAVRAKGSTD